MLKITHILFLIAIAAINTFASQRLVLQSKSATALNTVTLYPDSSFIKHSNIAFEEGSMFELIGESIEEHEDDAQNQKFKWYKVKSSTGKIGWIYGDALAIIVPDYQVDDKVRSFHKKKINLDSGFDEALMWIASMEGRDNFHAQDYMNPIYNEYYLVITNKLGKSVHINISGVNARGKNELTSLELIDMTDDFIPEILVQTISHSNHNNLPNKNIEIYGFQAGTLARLLEERLTLSYSDDLQSPAISKQIEIDKDHIRIEYIDYLSCAKYGQNISTQKINKKLERCMEYVTYTYVWNTRRKRYESLYDETRTSIKGTSKYDCLLKEHPSQTSKNMVKIFKNEPLKIVKHFEKVVMQGQTKKIEYYLLVQSKRGILGYLPANCVKFENIVHASILNDYYNQAPLHKNDWSSKHTFVQSSKKTMVSNKN